MSQRPGTRNKDPEKAVPVSPERRGIPSGCCKILHPPKRVAKQERSGMEASPGAGGAGVLTLSWDWLLPEHWRRHTPAALVLLTRNFLSITENTDFFTYFLSDRARSCRTLKHRVYSSHPARGRLVAALPPGPQALDRALCLALSQRLLLKRPWRFAKHFSVLMTPPKSHRAPCAHMPEGDAAKQCVHFCLLLSTLSFHLLNLPVILTRKCKCQHFTHPLLFYLLKKKKDCKATS